MGTRICDVYRGFQAIGNVTGRNQSSVGIQPVFRSPFKLIIFKFSRFHVIEETGKPGNRFFKKIKGIILLQRPFDVGEIGMAGKKNHLDEGIIFHDLHHQFKSVFSGHLDVCDDHFHRTCFELV